MHHNINKFSNFSDLRQIYVKIKLLYWPQNEKKNKDITKLHNCAKIIPAQKISKIHENVLKLSKLLLLY